MPREKNVILKVNNHRHAILKENVFGKVNSGSSVEYLARKTGKITFWNAQWVLNAERNLIIVPRRSARDFWE
jgi:hypothetical protein